MQKKTAGTSIGLAYFQKGDAPVWLIHSGMHGDEYGVIEPLCRYLEANETGLPDFIWVPEASPSAVAAKKRENHDGRDMNRAFKGVPTEPEAVANLAVIDGRRFKIFVSFHEDPTADKFYLYDEVTDASGTPAMAAFFDRVKSLGIGLHDGLDDPADPILGNRIRSGYFSGLWRSNGHERPDNGTLERFLANRKLAERILTTEAPGRATPAQKEAIIAAMFDYLLTLE